MVGYAFHKTINIKMICRIIGYRNERGVFMRTYFPMTASEFLAKLMNDSLSVGNNIYRKTSFNYPINTYAVKDDDSNIVGVIIEIALAGFNKDEIKVDINKDSEIKVAVEKKAEDLSDKSSIITNGISTKPGNIAFTCVVPIDVANTKVTFKDGLLRIDAPIKNEENGTTRLMIE